MKIQIRARNQITIPEKVLKELNLKQGDDLLVELKNGSITLIPAISIPRDEAYLFTPEWQADLHQAEKELAEGDYSEAESVEEMLRELDRED